MAPAVDAPRTGEDNPDAAPASIDGLTLLHKIIAGTHPPAPMAETLNFRLDEAEAGRVAFRGTPRADFANPLGTIHGGWAATLLDSALGCAVHSTLASGEGYTTVEFKVSLNRPITEATGECICEGRILHRGRRIATSEATLKDAEGRLLAHATGTCLVFPTEPR